MTPDPLDRLRAADPLRGELPGPLPAPPALPRRRAAGSRTLTLASALLVVAVAVHAVDHAFVQDRGLGGLELHVVLGGASMGAASVLSLLASLLRGARARPVALAAGSWVALLAGAGHFVPSSLSPLDPYAGLGLGAFSWAAAGAVVLAGAAVIAAAARARPR